MINVQSEEGDLSFTVLTEEAELSDSGCGGGKTDDGRPRPERNGRERDNN